MPLDLGLDPRHGGELQVYDVPEESEREDIHDIGTYGFRPVDPLVHEDLVTLVLEHHCEPCAQRQEETKLDSRC